MTYYSSLEDSIHLAVDTGIDDIIITGDFNLNMLNSQYARKINSLCQQFSLFQSISKPTHFTENSSSLIDLLLITYYFYNLLTEITDSCIPNRHVTIRPTEPPWITT